MDSNSSKSSRSLIKLHSKDHEEILDVIDQLRSEGISRYVGLPQIIVCGDQSSEVILRRASEEAVTVSILPDDTHSTEENERLRNFKPHQSSPEHFADIIHSAGDWIGVGKDGVLFSKDILRVELQGPKQSHLTLVDLPGLYHTTDESQDEKGVAFVESLVSSYLSNPRSVILAVISAKKREICIYITLLWDEGVAALTQTPAQPRHINVARRLGLEPPSPTPQLRHQHRALDADKPGQQRPMASSCPRRVRVRNGYQTTSAPCLRCSALPDE